MNDRKLWRTKPILNEYIRKMINTFSFIKCLKNI